MFIYYLKLLALESQNCLRLKLDLVWRTVYCSKTLSYHRNLYHKLILGLTKVKDSFLGPVTRYYMDISVYPTWKYVYMPESCRIITGFTIFQPGCIAVVLCFVFLCWCVIFSNV